MTYTGSSTQSTIAFTQGEVITLTAAGTQDKIDIQLNSAWQGQTDGVGGTITIASNSTTSFTYKVGTGTGGTASDDITVSVNSIGKTALGVTGDVLTAAAADLSSAAVSNAIDDIQTYRATIGANQNRLEFAMANVATSIENTEAARSGLLDLDIASEMARFTSKQILVQAGVAMLAQANQLPGNLLRLFQ